MSIDELISLEKRFQPYLLPGDYTFIGPADHSLLSGFVQNANFIGPYDWLSTTYRRPLTDKPTIMKTISLLPAGSELRIYIVVGKVEKAGLFLHSTIEEYCRKNQIDFQYPPSERNLTGT